MEEVGAEKGKADPHAISETIPGHLQSLWQQEGRVVYAIVYTLNYSITYTINGSTCMC